jgi:uncharacterized protein YhbP (UPF0306 family)
MTLATNGQDGTWAAAVFYASDQFDCYFLSAGHTRHANHIEQTGRAGATVQEDYAEWRDIKGIQMEGMVQQMLGDERLAAIDRYVAKYPYIQSEAQLSTALEKVNWYRLRPDRLYFIDNSEGFGHRDRIL